MPDIILSTINAKFIHSSFGLRYLYANLGELQDRAQMLEFDIQWRTVDMVEQLLAASPQIIGLGVYIWNVEETLKVISMLKQVRPEVVIILGGPEVSYEWEGQPVVELADYLITGEADLKFAEVCRAILQGSPPANKIQVAPLPELDQVRMPYEFYSETDRHHRVVYVEMSRGCPFTCEFCLSSLDIPVRTFPLEAFLEAMEKLLEGGLKHFKFVDRTFNLNLKLSQRILEFFWDRYFPGLFLHFEMVPDRLPEGLREWIRKFPPGALQFEVGIQTFNEDVAQRIRRRQNLARLEDNFKFLRSETGVHIHADLIAGLPGEDLKSFAAGFDRLVHLQPQEIQLGILKRLKGTPIIRQDAEWEMVYRKDPPFEILRNRSLSFEELQGLRRFARFWDLIGNSGHFTRTLPLIWADGISPFASFWEASIWWYQRFGGKHGIALSRLFEGVFAYLTEIKGLEENVVAEALWEDYQRGGRSDRPAYLLPFLTPEQLGTVPYASQNHAPDGGKGLPRRQGRHADLPKEAH